MASPLDIFNASMAGAERGRERGLAQLLGKAYAAPKEQRAGILGQVASLGAPQAAFDAASHFRSMDDNARADFGRYAVAFDALPDAQKAVEYPNFARQAQQFGIPAPLEWKPEFAPNISKLAQALGGGQTQGIPAGVQEFQYLTQGLGADDVAKARRIQLGLDGRASSAGFSFDTLTGADGRERPITRDPRTGEVRVFDEATGQFVPLAGGGAAPQPPAMGGAGMFAGLAAIPGLTVTSGLRSPADNARVNGVPNSYHLTGQALDILPPGAQQAPMVRQWAAQNDMEIIDEGDHWHLEPRGNAPRSAPPALGVSQTPQEKKFAEESGTQAARIAALPTVGQIEADNAGMKARSEAQAKAEVERAVAQAKKAFDAGNTLDVLDSAETLLQAASGGAIQAGRDRVLGAFNVSTEGAQATAGLKLLAAKLIANVPRFEGPQSNIDVQFYREAAGDLANDALPTETRLAALQTMRQLNMKYAGSTGGRDEPPGGDLGSMSDDDILRALR